MAALRIARRRLVDVLVLAVVAGGATHAVAEDTFYSITEQNHVLAGTDQNGYTNGIFFSRLRVASGNETSVDAPLLLIPLTWLGLPKATMASTSLSQIMISPDDLEVRNPPPNDTPYAGELLLRSVNMYQRDDVIDMLALNLGVLGPGSGARQTQEAIHDILNATDPEGWHTQGPTKWAVGVEAYRAWRYAWMASSEGRSSDIVTLVGAGAGNRESSVGASFVVRYGTGLGRSFPLVIPGTQHSAEPMPVRDNWYAFAGLWGNRVVSELGIGSAPPGNISDLKRTQFDPFMGFTYGWAQSSLTFSLHSRTPLTTASNDRQPYGSINYTWLSQ